MLVSGALPAEIVRSLPAAGRPRHRRHQDDLQCGSAPRDSTLMLLPAEEHLTKPTMPATTGTVGADAFASAIHQVAIAADRDDTPLPALTGIRMELNEDTLTLVATDCSTGWPSASCGGRAGRAWPRAPARSSSPPGSWATPRGRRPAAPRSPSRFSTTQGDARRHHRLREGGGRRTTTRLTSGEAPALPDPAAQRAPPRLPNCPRLVFADAVKRVALVAERNTPVRLTFATSEVLLEAERVTRHRPPRQSRRPSTARR